MPLTQVLLSLLGIVALGVLMVVMLRKMAIAQEKQARSNAPHTSLVPPATPPVSPAAPLAQGWIRLDSMPVGALRAHIQSHASVATPDVPIEVEVTIALHPGNYMVVDFPKGVPAYNLVNLVAWLNDGGEGVTGFLTPPRSDIRYALYQNEHNQSGDTAIGTGSDGSRIEVYLPEGTVSRSGDAEVRIEPDRSAAIESDRFLIVLDGTPDFGNPSFLIR